MGVYLPHVLNMKPRGNPQTGYEYVNCALCGQNNNTILFEGKDRRCKMPGKFNIVKCKNCGLVYINPRPTKNEIKKFYPENYEFYRQIEVNENQSLSFWQHTKELIVKTNIGGELKIIKDRLDNILLGEIPKIRRLEGIKKGKVLDLGCGIGVYLKTLKELEWETVGIDINFRAVKIAKESFGLNVFCGELHDLSFPDKSFDVVTAYASFEHVHNPSKLLQEVHRVLKNSGLFVIYLQNSGCIELKIFKTYWYHLDVPRHLYNFSTKTLKAILHKNGFSVTKVCYDPDPNGIIFSLNWFADDKKIPINVPYNYFTYYLFLPFGLIFSKILHNSAKMAICARKYNN